MGPVHAGLVMLLRSAPRLVIDMMIERGVLRPGDYAVEVRPTESWIFPQGRVSERRVDLVLEIRRSDGWRGGVFIETQLSRDETKPDRWGSLRQAWEHELGPHLFLVPITLSRSVEDWLRHWVLPFVDDLQGCLIGPGTFPRWSKFDRVAEPERALFMAMISERGTTRTRRLRAAIGVLDQFQDNNRVIYEQMLLEHFSERMLMNARNQYQPSEQEVEALLALSNHPDYKPNKRNALFALRKTKKESCEGLIQAIFKVLELRRVELSEPARERLVGCDDPLELVRWINELLSGADAEALLA